MSWTKPTNDAMANRRRFSDAELLEGCVPCPLCGAMVKPSARYGNLIRDFDCQDCGALWRGDRKGRPLSWRHLDLCA